MKSIQNDPYVRSLEADHGAELDALPWPSQLALFAADPFRQQLLRRYGAQSYLIRPDLLSVLRHRAQSARPRQLQLLESSE